MRLNYLVNNHNACVFYFCIFSHTLDYSRNFYYTMSHLVYWSLCHQAAR